MIHDIVYFLILVALSVVLALSVTYVLFCVAGSLVCAIDYICGKVRDMKNQNNKI